jgi:uncharacterized tellurite resistance protein B-like protein
MLQRCGATVGQEMAKFRANFEIAMLRSMLAMARADGAVHDGELEQVASIMTGISGSAIEIEEIREAAADTAQTSLADVLEDVSGSLNDRGKAMVVQALHAIASADSEFSDSEMKLLVKAGKHLGLGRADVKKIVQAAA